MGTGARVLAGFQIPNQGFLFLRRKHLPAFDRDPLAHPCDDAFLDGVFQRRFVFLSSTSARNASAGLLLESRAGTARTWKVLGPNGST